MNRAGQIMRSYMSIRMSTTLNGNPVMEPWWPLINKNNRGPTIIIVACTIAWIVNGKKFLTS